MRHSLRDGEADSTVSFAVEKAVVDELLDRHDLTAGEVRGWALQPGNRATVAAVNPQLGFRFEALRESRTVLRGGRSCSSATVLLVSERIRRKRDFEGGDAVVAMAWRPGLALCAALLRAAVARPRPLFRDRGVRR